MNDESGKKPKSDASGRPDAEQTEKPGSGEQPGGELAEHPDKVEAAAVGQPGGEDGPASSAAASPGPEPPPDAPEKGGKELWKGIGLTALLHLLLLVFPMAYFAIGVAQLIYIVPAALIAWRMKRIGIVQGLLIGAGITFLLNAACFGIVWGSFR